MFNKHLALLSFEQQKRLIEALTFGIDCAEELRGIHVGNPDVTVLEDYDRQLSKAKSIICDLIDSRN